MTKRDIKELRCKDPSHHIFLIVEYFLFLSFFPKRYSRNVRGRFGQMKVPSLAKYFFVLGEKEKKKKEVLLYP